MALFSVDDFRRPVDWSRADRREVDSYYDDYYALDELERCLQAFRAGAPQRDHPGVRFAHRVARRASGPSISAARASRSSKGCSRCASPTAAAGLVIYSSSTPPRRAAA